MSDTIRAREFVVVDAEGKDRAKLGSEHNAVVLKMEGDQGGCAALSVEAGGARFELCIGERTIQLAINESQIQVRLTDKRAPEAKCGMTIDDAGAWVYAEATREIGVRLLSKRDGEGTSVWLAEKQTDHDEVIVRTRYLRPTASEDSTGCWQFDR